MTAKGVSEVQDLHYSHVVYKFRSPTGHKVVDSEVQLGYAAYINADRVPCRLVGAVLSWRTRKSGRTRCVARPAGGVERPGAPASVLLVEGEARDGTAESRLPRAHDEVPPKTNPAVVPWGLLELEPM